MITDINSHEQFEKEAAIENRAKTEFQKRIAADFRLAINHTVMKTNMLSVTAGALIGSFADSNLGAATGTAFVVTSILLNQAMRNKPPAVDKRSEPALRTMIDNNWPRIMLAHVLKVRIPADGSRFTRDADGPMLRKTTFEHLPDDLKKKFTRAAQEVGFKSTWLAPLYQPARVAIKRAKRLKKRFNL